MHFVRASAAAFTLLSAGLPAARAQTTVVLVRHAEKVDESKDAALSEQGKARARALAAMLKDAGIESIHSTDYIRTRDTAKPLADALSKPIQIYDGDDLEGLARELRAQETRALVVGHSDTTPELVRILGGESTPIASGEYDRLYVVVLLPDGTATTTLLRFPSPATMRGGNDRFQGVER